MSTQEPLSPGQRIACAIGVFVLQSQEMEHLFKFLVAMTGTDDPSLSAKLSFAAAIEKRSLGKISGLLVDGFAGDTEPLKAHIKRIVDERNEVVHHFSKRFGSLMAEGRHDAILQELKNRRERAEELVLIFRELALEILETLRDTTYVDTDEYQEFATLCAKLRARQQTAP